MKRVTRLMVEMPLAVGRTDLQIPLPDSNLLGGQVVSRSSDPNAGEDSAGSGSEVSHYTTADPRLLYTAATPCSQFGSDAYAAALPARMSWSVWTPHFAKVCAAHLYWFATPLYFEMMPLSVT